jgi:hypothetical protein
VSDYLDMGGLGAVGHGLSAVGCKERIWRCETSKRENLSPTDTCMVSV